MELCPERGFPDQPSWGYAFTYLAALQNAHGAQTQLSRKALSRLVGQDTTSPDYPWEFVVYALQKSLRLDVSARSLGLAQYREKGTRMFNWFLLRKLNKQLYNIYTPYDDIKLRIGLGLFQARSGYIHDELMTRSLQYHAFCLFLLAELLSERPDDRFLKSRFISGVLYSLRSTLPDGTALYIGRGQEQIFGYGALIYALEYFNSHVEVLPTDIVENIAKHVLMFQRKDGSFPLVLRSRFPEPPNVSFSRNTPYGWYGYNTLYDYQPFLAYCLLRASNL
jgi:hypothetical protein